jgi:peptidoglycan/xylan/chitin deacetylase (PgdA/CDA1 family)
MHTQSITRRRFIAGLASAGSGLALANASPPKEPLLSITLDLEMSRNFPTWERTEWDYEKGNLNEETKAYALEACRRVRKAGGVIHCFAVGRVFEQANVDWLKEIVRAGHPVGNHTYDHVNVKATRPADLQFRFQRSPWLIQGKTPQEVIVENIRLTNAAINSRLGIAPSGFRTPGGFHNGLADRSDLQRMLLDLGFTWVSSKYPAHKTGEPSTKPSKEVLADIVKSQEVAQPFVYPSGLVEVPMSPPSDVTAFRAGRWKLEFFLDAIRHALTRAIETKAVFDFLGHPSCLYVTDPKFETIEMICDVAKRKGVPIASLDVLARRARR